MSGTIGEIEIRDVARLAQVLKVVGSEFIVSDEIVRVLLNSVFKECVGSPDAA